jgi:glutamine phosphoribosylpyrophosphate amidotransferase
MCALFGSPDRKLFEELARLNSYRGNHSFSVATFDFKDVKIITRALGEFQMPLTVAPYYIGHTQAPTTEAKSTSSIHPSSVRDEYLWHNGIIKDHQVKKWQRELNVTEPWDTRLMHLLLSVKLPADVLSNADGSFACVWYHSGELYLFRNTNCPLFTDGTSYSSTKFSGSESIKEDIMYKLTDNGIVETNTSFKTVNNFFWSPE